MNTQKLIAITAGAVFLLGAAATAANAASSITVSGSYTADLSTGVGNEPTLSTASSPDLSSLSGSSPDYSGSFTGSNALSLTLNGTGTTDNLLTIDPSGSCGSGCSHDISDATITLDFSSIVINGVAATPTSSSDTGVFYADYNSTGPGSETLSAAGDCSTTSSGDDTDCVVWSSGNDPLVFTADTATEDYTLSIDLVDAQDWNITPTVDFTLTGTPVTPPTVPEPASMVLFASALLGLPVLRRRMSGKAPATTAAA